LYRIPAAGGGLPRFLVLMAAVQVSGSLAEKPLVQARGLFVASFSKDFA